MASEALEGGQLRGGILVAHLRWLEEHVPGGASAAQARVSADTARLLSGPLLPISWYPFRALIELDRAIAALTGQSERDICVELGRHSARSNLGKDFRFYNRTRPNEFFASAARVHDQFVDFGREEYAPDGETACTLKLCDYRCYSKLYCWSALGYYSEAIGLQGGSEGQAVERECVCEGAPACVFHLRWA